MVDGLVLGKANNGVYREPQIRGPKCAPQGSGLVWGLPGTERQPGAANGQQLAGTARHKLGGSSGQEGLPKHPSSPRPSTTALNPLHPSPGPHVQLRGQLLEATRADL